MSCINLEMSQGCGQSFFHTSHPISSHLLQHSYSGRQCWKRLEQQCQSCPKTVRQGSVMVKYPYKFQSSTQRPIPIQKCEHRKWPQPCKWKPRPDIPLPVLAGVHEPCQLGPSSPSAREGNCHSFDVAVYSVDCLHSYQALSCHYMPL